MRITTVLATLTGALVLLWPPRLPAEELFFEDFDSGSGPASTLGVADILNPSLVYAADTRNTQLLSLVQGQSDELGAAWLGRVPLAGHRTIITFDFWIRHASSLAAGEGLSVVLQLGEDLGALGDGGGRLGTCNFPTDYVSVAFDVLDNGVNDPETWCDTVAGPHTCHAEINSSLCPAAEPSTRTNITFGVETPNFVRVGDQLIPIHATLVIDDGVLDVYVSTDGDPAFTPQRVQVLTAALGALEADRALLGFIGSTSNAYDSHIEVDNVRVTTTADPLESDTIAFGRVHRPLGQAALEIGRDDQLVVSNIGASGDDGVRIELGLPLDELRADVCEVFEFDAPPLPDKGRKATRELLLLSENDDSLARLVLADEDGTRFRVSASVEGTRTPPEAMLLLDGEVVATFPADEFYVPTGPDVVEVCTSGGSDPVFLRYELERVMVVSYSVGGAAMDARGDTIIINYTGLETSVVPGAVELRLHESDFAIVDERRTDDGRTERALGQARISRGRDGLVVISNIGSSGEDGVLFVPPEPVSFARLELGPIEPGPCGGLGIPGVNFCGFGEARDGSSVLLGGFELEQAREGWQLVPDVAPTGASAALMSYRRQGVELGRSTLKPGASVDLPAEAKPRYFVADSFSFGVEREMKFSVGFENLVLLNLDDRRVDIDEIVVQPIDPDPGFGLIAETCVQFICVDPIHIEPIFSAGDLPTADLVAGGLEVTQGIQNLQTDVRLVAGKRTFVRFHVSSAEGEHGTFAELQLTKANQSTVIYPMFGNGFFGHIGVEEDPDRTDLDDSFIFELPAGYRSGVVQMTAVLNPITDWRSRNPFETSYANNTTTTSVLFETVNPMHLVLYRVVYQDGGFLISTPQWEIDQMVQWLKRAYPIDDLVVWQRTLVLGALPDTGQTINSTLANLRTVDIIQWIAGFGSVPPTARYYAMASDAGSFMRGWGWSNPPVASGPTGGSRWANPASSLFWDDDGSYGDWYGGHEIAHSFGRNHPDPAGDPNTGDNVIVGCGHPMSDPSYPYAGACISQIKSGNAAYFGVDLGPTWRVPDPDWKDVMSYCDFQWISDYTYEGLLDQFQTVFGGGGGGGGGLPPEADGQRLLIVGRSYREGFELEPIFQYADVGDLKERRPGDWSIVLSDARGDVLARYPFTPEETGPGPADPEAPPSGVDTEIAIYEFVPYEPGTTTVEIFGPDGIEAVIDVGAGVPTVTVDSPNGGEVLDADPITVSWTASDPDGDPLVANVEYSADDGATWQAVAAGLESTSHAVPRADLPSSDGALFRVTVSDGLNTSSDVSDGTFTVVNQPPRLQVLEPVGPVSICSLDTLVLRASVHDADDSAIDGSDFLVWNSHRDGLLGRGAELTVTGLSVGVHEITVEADDGKGGVTDATLPPVTVVENPLLVSQEVDALITSPDSVQWIFGTNTSTRLRVLNQNAARSLRFSVVDQSEWIAVGETGGETSGALTISLQNGGDLEPGDYDGQVTLFAPDIGQKLEIPVQLSVPVLVVNPPVGRVFRRGDSNDDGSLNISDPVFVLGCLFAGSACPSCPDAADINDTGTIDITDAVYALNFSFSGGPPPESPWPGCGEDPTADALGSCVFQSCP